MNRHPFRALIFLFSIAATMLAIAPTNAADSGEYRLCNNTSYIIDAAIGIEFQDATATQGWFRVYPGACRSILTNTQDGERYFLHTRTPIIYDKIPEPAAISRMLCIRDEEFLLASAESCSGDKGSLAPFSRLVPGDGNSISTVTLKEAANFSGDQARIAGLQRLLTLADLDPGPIDGSPGDKTTVALDTIRRQYNLALGASDHILFATLISAALNSGGATGLTLCNETGWKVLAAVGTLSNGVTQSQGWFELPANRCTKILRSAINSNVIHVFAEAVDDNGRPALVGTNLIRWEGETKLCTKSIRFNITDQKDCELRGLEATDFRSFDLNGAEGRIVWLREGQ